ncbi:MAG: hypothetical protein MJZ07_09100 [Bacteroidales bacterium]|nr:hypothetical protein [Bacteroidales bacterium]
MKKLLYLAAIAMLAIVSCKKPSDLPVLTLSEAELAFDAESSAKTLTVTSNRDWLATTDAGWIAVEQTEKILKVLVSENDSFDPREAEITVTAGELVETVKVTQEGKPAATLAVSPSELNFTSEAGSKDVTVSANYEWTATTTASWLQLQKAGDKLTVSAAENTSFDPRSATISFKLEGKEETVKVTQEGKPAATIALSPSELNFTSEAGSKDVTVSANYEWTATTTASWLQLQKAGDKLTVSAAENTSANSRSATISIKCEGKEEKVTVAQSAPTILNLAKNSWASNGIAMTLNLEIEANHTVTAEVTTNTPWLTVSLSRYNGKYTARIQVEENATNGKRNGNVRISSNGVSIDFPVEQDFRTLSISDSYMRTYLLGNYDINSDGLLSLYEVGKVDKIDLDAPVYSFPEVVYFTSLSELKLKNANLTSLDVHGFQNLWILTLENVKVSNLAFNDCPKLARLEVVNAPLSTISSFDGCSALKILQFRDGFNLSSINLADHIALQSLSLINGSVSTVDMSGLIYLSSCNFYGLNVSSVKTSRLVSLRYMTMSYCSLNTSIDLSSCRNLVSLDDYGSKVNTYDLSGLTMLEEVTITGLENLVAINLEGAVSLEKATVNINPNLHSINLKNCSSLYKLVADRCGLYQIAGLETCTSLKSIDARSNNLGPTIDLSHCANVITYLDLYYNKNLKEIIINQRQTIDYHIIDDQTKFTRVNL